MKTTFLGAAAAVCAVLAAAPAVPAQSVTVTPAKAEHRRTKPIDSFKRSFTIVSPRISGVPAEVKKDIESALDYEKVFGFTVEEEKNESQWLEEAYYRVDLNRGGVLSVTLTISGSAAYPSQSSARLSFDTRSGARISMAEELGDNIPRLIAALNRLVKAEVGRYRRLYRQPRYEVDDPDSLFSETEEFTPEGLENFTVGPKGISFFYDYGFPHVIQALQPPGRFFLPWGRLKPYIRPSGPFTGLWSRKPRV